VSPSPLQKKEADAVSETLSSYLKFRTVDEVHELSYSECHTRASKPFRSTGSHCLKVFQFKQEGAKNEPYNSVTLQDCGRGHVTN
jgi:hypothetical protein